MRVEDFEGFEGDDVDPAFVGAGDYEPAVESEDGTCCELFCVRESALSICFWVNCGRSVGCCWERGFDEGVGGGGEGAEVGRVFEEGGDEEISVVASLSVCL